MLKLVLLLFLLIFSFLYPYFSFSYFRINKNYLAPAAADETPIIVRNIGDVNNPIIAQIIPTPLQIYCFLIMPITPKSIETGHNTIDKINIPIKPKTKDTIPKALLF
ncbi:hypothetical protein JPFTNV_15750 [Francisella tularensis subsp. holarctica]|nr:hypothetical protein JPFTNV_15750 [Francisella tularensis subsp. holarctica]BCL54456.1 hypothetical protein JPFTKU_02700 [Francisella tularensis subsp. holarctica]